MPGARRDARADDHRPVGGHDFELPSFPSAVDVFDTTLRDGSQQEGLSLTVDDKLRVAEQLDHLGVTFIEGGWPGANPKDEEFFARAPTELRLSTATLVAFGSTRRADVRAEDDETLRHLVNAQTEAVCIVAKSSEMHVVDALRTTLDEAVAMVADSVAFLRANDLRVFLDAEHFFDGYKANPEFTLRILQAAEDAGAETLVLCDTNGGTLPYEVERIVETVLGRFETQVGVHFHNDSSCAVANSLAGVAMGATHVQGCVNGYGERSGNADLAAAIPNLSLKLKVATIPDDRLELLTPVSHHIAELVNISPNPQQPYVGSSVFAHKAGLHTSAIARRSDAYEHIQPDLVGNGTRFVVSELAGRSTLVMKAAELGLELDSQAMTSVLDSLKQLEYEGYHFEVADGSLELLLPAPPGGNSRSSSWSPTGSSPTRTPSSRPRPRSSSPWPASGWWPPPRATAPSTHSTGRSGRPSGRTTRPCPASIWSTTGSGCSTRPRAPDRSPGCSSTRPTATAPGPPSASRRTSSPPRGRPSPTPSSTVCCTRPTGDPELDTGRRDMAPCSP